jgi:hypothetical protein
MKQKPHWTFWLVMAGIAGWFLADVYGVFG